MNISNIDQLTQTKFFMSSHIQAPQKSFSGWLMEKIEDTNQKLTSADEHLVHLASGDAESLHKTMLTLEEARLSFQLTEQIRNRLMQAFQELTREQI